MKKPLIMDCDPGRDDAIALMMLGKDENYELLGITTVAGNHTVSHTFNNAQRLSAWLGIEAPVFRGCEGPLLREPVIAPEIHGDTGLDGFDEQCMPKHQQTEHAINWLVNTLLAATEPVTLLVTGPMTNIAMALRLAPAILSHIARIVLMGGSMTLGNVTPAAEFNMYADPEAARIVFTSGADLYMAGLDVTLKALCDTETITRMSAQNNPAAKLFHDLMTPYCEAESRIYGMPQAPVHDPVAVAILQKPDLLTFRDMHVTIDCTPAEGYGRTYCDYYNTTGLKPNCHVATNLNTQGFWNLVEHQILKYN